METQAATYIISASAVVPARRDVVYALIANYRDGHPRILPRQFSNLVVDEGGVGAGTVIRFQMRLLGRTKSFRAAITEPEPGRVLVETDLDTNGAITTFTVDAGTAPADSRVTISTAIPRKKGVAGWLEEMLATMLLRPIYLDELANLARVATGPFAG